VIALLGDIHSNLQALTACLDDAGEQNVSKFVFLGDYVGYGGDPVAVLTLIQGLCASGAIAVKGNHDDMACDFDRLMNPSAACAARWTREQLSPHWRAFLDAMPLEVKDEDRHYVHADTTAPEKWRYVTDMASARDSLSASDRRIVFCGHVHQPALYAMNQDGAVSSFVPEEDCVVPLIKSRRWHVVIPSVGQPRDGNPLAGYALYNPQSAEISFRRVPYDIEAAAGAITAAGLPVGLANRLHKGR
jgi:diadenosine tetraphosphatase ApaH/serine/threonine PP2A family protein phosphatase